MANPRKRGLDQVPEAQHLFLIQVDPERIRNRRQKSFSTFPGHLTVGRFISSLQLLKPKPNGLVLVSLQVVSPCQAPINYELVSCLPLFTVSSSFNSVFVIICGIRNQLPAECLFGNVQQSRGAPLPNKPPTGLFRHSPPFSTKKDKLSFSLLLNRTLDPPSAK